MLDTSKTCIDYNVKLCHQCTKGWFSTESQCYIKEFATSLANPHVGCWDNSYCYDMQDPKAKIDCWHRIFRSDTLWLRKAIEVACPEYLSYFDALMLLQ